MLTLFVPRIARLKTDSTEDAYSFMNTGALRELMVPLPPLAVQEDFFSWVAKARDCRKRTQRLSIEAERLQGAPAQLAFRGEL